MRSEMKTVDLSRISESNTKIPMSNYMNFEREILKVRYPVKAISAAKDLKTKIQDFKNSKVKKQLFQVLKGLNSYRQVRGDGNCFFRSIAFTHLVDKQTTKFKHCFEFIDKVSLTCCYPQSIPKDFQKFYDHQFLKTMLESHWENKFNTLLRQNARLHMKALLKLFDENPFLDFIVILYYRAVCLKAFTYFRSEVADFLDSSQQTVIRKYSQESEGIILDLCSRMLKIEIYVYEIRKQSVSKYVYNNFSSFQGSIHLLFYENHYDIIEKNEHIDAQMSILGGEDEEYFGEVNEKLTNGTCFECGTSGLVYEETGLCIKCYQGSMNNLQIFKKDKLITARCSQCFFTKKDVSQQFGLCKDCISIQNQFQKKQKEKPKMKKIQQKCPQCKLQQYLIQQVGLCRDCTEYQRKIYQYHRSPQKSSIISQSRHQSQQEENRGSHIEKSRVRQSEIKQSGVKSSVIRQSGIKNSAIRQSGIKNSAIRQSGIKNSEIRQEKKTEQNFRKTKYTIRGECKGCKYKANLHEDNYLCVDCIDKKNSLLKPGIHFKSQLHKVSDKKQQQAVGFSEFRSLRCLNCKNVVKRINQRGLCLKCSQL